MSDPVPATRPETPADLAARAAAMAGDMRYHITPGVRGLLHDCAVALASGPPPACNSLGDCEHGGAPATKGFRIAGESATDAVGEEFGRLIAERDRLQWVVGSAPSSERIGLEEAIDRILSLVWPGPWRPTREQVAEVLRAVSPAGPPPAEPSETLCYTRADAENLIALALAADRAYRAASPAGPEPSQRDADLILGRAVDDEREACAALVEGIAKNWPPMSNARGALFAAAHAIKVRAASPAGAPEGPGPT